MTNPDIDVANDASSKVNILGEFAGYVGELKAELDQLALLNFLATAGNPADPASQEYDEVIRGSDQTATVIHTTSDFMYGNEEGAHQALRGLNTASESAAQMNSFDPTGKVI